jgi:carboxyl-terminal processing protease
MRRYRSLSAAAFVVVLCAIVGGFFGRSAILAQDRATDAQVEAQFRVLSEALDAVQQHYVGDLEPDRVIYSAISGMLQTLDPHSSFMDPRSYAAMRERQEGRYYGLGISINVIDGDITVATVYENTPAYESGLRRGDVIARIESEDTKGWQSTQAVAKLKGPKGTTVNISIKRTGYDKLIPLTVRRDEVHIPTIIAAVMLDSSTGYIKMSEFAETTDQELGRALRDLTRQGMRRLVFDLRGNPGGALDQAIKVSNRFLPKGDLIVYTRGRTSNSAHDYRAEQNGEYLNLPMVTLVNRSSASASEIVSGALQDHDRSLIVGETTFGKALVQSVYRVQNAGAAITTARYYTPSGRMIQRPWDGTFDEYMTYAYREQDPNKAHRDDQMHTTDGGRKVYSGGGVEPDRRFDAPVEGFNPTRFGRTVAARDLFDMYARRFSRRGDTRIAPSTSSQPRELNSGFDVTDEMMAEFKDFVKQQRVVMDEASWQKDEEFFRAMIRKEIDTDLFGLSAAYKNLAMRDPQLKFAVTLFPEAQQLLDLDKATSTRVQR